MLFLYAHLSGWIASQGQTYDGSGFLLGYNGTTGCSTGPHLHLEIRRGGVPMDPLVYINQVESAAGE
jgi:murein DD-endopeptidase MepM/ murein hydrolase activator NlpD